jgi:hypothetical protein
MRLCLLRPAQGTQEHTYAPSQAQPVRCTANPLVVPLVSGDISLFFSP